MFLVSIVCVAAGIWLGARSYLALRGATIIDGRVVYLDEFDQLVEGGTARTTWPVIEFNNIQGEPRSIVAPYNQALRPGDSVRVMYSAVTNEAEVYSPLRMWLPGGTLLCLGIGLMMFGPS